MRKNTMKKRLNLNKSTITTLAKEEVDKVKGGTSIVWPSEIATACCMGTYGGCQSGGTSINP